MKKFINKNNKVSLEVIEKSNKCVITQIVSKYRVTTSINSAFELFNSIGTKCLLETEEYGSIGAIVRDANSIGNCHLTSNSNSLNANLKEDEIDEIKELLQSQLKLVDSIEKDLTEDILTIPMQELNNKKLTIDLSQNKDLFIKYNHTVELHNDKMQLEKNESKYSLLGKLSLINEQNTLTIILIDTHKHATTLETIKIENTIIEKYRNIFLNSVNNIEGIAC